MTKEKIMDDKSKSNLIRRIRYRITPIGIIQQIADVANLKLA